MNPLTASRDRTGAMLIAGFVGERWFAVVASPGLTGGTSTAGARMVRVVSRSGFWP